MRAWKKEGLCGKAEVRTMAKYTMDKRFSSFFRPHAKDRITQLLTYAGIESNPEVWLGSRIFIILLFALVGALLPFSVF